MTKVVIDKSRVTMSGKILRVFADIEDCQRSNYVSFNNDNIEISIDLENAIYLAGEMNAIMLLDLVSSIKQFDNQTYHDKSGHKEVYVLKQSFMGYKKDAKFFSRGDYLFPVGALPGNIGFKLDIAMKMDLLADATKSYAASYIDNNVAIIHDPELSIKEGDFIKINGIGMYKVTKKYVSLQSVMNKEYVMVGLG